MLDIEIVRRCTDLTFNLRIHSLKYSTKNMCFSFCMLNEEASVSEWIWLWPKFSVNGTALCLFCIYFFIFPDISIKRILKLQFNLKSLIFLFAEKENFMLRGIFRNFYPQNQHAFKVMRIRKFYPPAIWFSLFPQTELVIWLRYMDFQLQMWA